MARHMDLGTLIVGDTLDRNIAVPGYSAADGWTLKYRLVPRVSGTPIAISSSADGDEHHVVVAAATTAGWAAGNYSWTAYVDHTDGRSHTVQTGAIVLAPNPRTSSAPLDLRSDAERALAAAEAALAAWTPTTRSYTIGSRSMTFSTSAEILPIISYWKMAVQREKRAALLKAGLPDPRKTHVRLGRV
jgi:hypothetical protein